MVVQFIKLRIRETTRSSAWNKSIIINIILALSILYMAVCFLVMGFFLDRILTKSFPDRNLVEVFNSALLYYFGLELLIRFFMQQTPAMSITSFLHLPVRRSSIMHFLLARSVINPANYISFFIFIPFAFRAVSAIYSGVAACWWLLSLFMLVTFVIYLNAYIKRQMVVKPSVTLSCGLAYITLIVLDYFKIFSLSELSSSLFGAVLGQPLWVFVPMLLVLGVYLLNYRFLMVHSYPEEIDRTSIKKQVAVQNLGFMSRFGLIGELVGLELKLILRHKRTKSTIFTSFLFMLYGLWLYYNPHLNNNTEMLIPVGIFVTGMAMLNYGQFIIAWEGKFFDGILTRTGNISDYFRAKYYLLVLFCLVGYILTTPYAFFGMKILLIQTVCLLFNIGVGALSMLWFALYSRKSMNLSQGRMMNWQGVGASQFISTMPAIILPMLIAFLVKKFGFENWGLGVLALLGVTGILCHKWIIYALCRRFVQTKYAQAEGFRSND